MVDWTKVKGFHHNTIIQQQKKANHSQKQSEIQIYILMTVRLTLLFRVWATLKSTRHRYMPESVSRAFCIANSPGSFSNRKYARFANTSSSDHRLAALKSLSRISTLLQEAGKKKFKNNEKFMRFLCVLIGFVLLCKIIHRIRYLNETVENSPQPLFPI